LNDLINIKKLLNNPHLLGQALGYTKLNRTHSEWIKYIWLNKGSPERPIQAHRGSYKSVSIVVVGAIWYNFFNPNSPVLICRETFEHSQATLNEIADHLEGPIMAALFREHYGIDHFSLRQRTGKRLVLPTKTRKSAAASIEARGMKGSITGAHFDRIHTDDIVTYKDRFSQKKRKETIAFIEELFNILNPGGIMSHSGTPWHKDDAFSKMPPPKKYPLGTINIKEFTPTHIRKLREKMSTSKFAANYLLKHIADEDRLFPDAQFNDIPARLPLRAHLDCKYRGTDTMALTFGGKRDGKIYLYGKIFYRNIEEMYGKITNLIKEMSAGTLYLETNADKGLAGTEFRKRGIIVSDYHEATNKHVKIMHYLKGNYSKVFFDERTDEDYINQIIEYQEGEDPDDAPDSAASMIRALGVGARNNRDFYKNQ